MSNSQPTPRSLPIEPITSDEQYRATVALSYERRHFILQALEREVEVLDALLAYAENHTAEIQELRDQAEQAMKTECTDFDDQINECEQAEIEFSNDRSSLLDAISSVESTIFVNDVNEK